MSGYETLWGSKLLSDVEVLLIENATELGTKRKQEVTLSGHKVILACNSESFKAQVSFAAVREWSDAASNSSSDTRSTQQIRIDVPPGQLETGQLLLKCTYQDTPDVSTASQVELLHLLLLADKYAVAKVAAAICRRFQDLPVADLEWETALQVFQLPESISLSSQYEAVCTAAEAKLQLQLGDLDAAWQDEHKQQQLLQLPLSVLLELLSSRETRVASEDTAAYTALRWIAAEVERAFPGEAVPGLQTEGVSDPQRVAVLQGLRQKVQQVMGLVRMAEYSQTYKATVVSTDPYISSTLTAYELQIAALCTANQRVVPRDNPVLREYLDWCDRPRPLSAIRSFKVSWQLPLVEIEKLFELRRRSNEHNPAAGDYVKGPSCLWEGHMLHFCIVVSMLQSNRKASKSNVQIAKGLASGSSIKPCVLLTGDGQTIVKPLVIRTTYLAHGGSNITNVDIFSQHHPGGRILPLDCSYVSLAPGDWPTARLPLDQQGLVHPDACLHIEFEVARNTS